MKLTFNDKEESGVHLEFDENDDAKNLAGILYGLTTKALDGLIIEEIYRVCGKEKTMEIVEIWDNFINLATQAEDLPVIRPLRRIKNGKNNQVR